MPASTRSTVYRRFSDKEALVDALFERHLDGLILVTVEAASTGMRDGRHAIRDRAIGEVRRPNELL
jgi:AcrR family transcriptional regulator